MKVEYIIVHHTGAEEKDAEQVRRCHLSLGWRDVGYNYIIERDGRVAAGRSLDVPGAHCRDAGMNFKSAGVAVIGNLMDHLPTPEQWRTLTGLVRELCRRYNIPPERVLGHNEVPGAATDCPGRFMDMGQVRAEAAAAPAGAGEAAAGEAGNRADGEIVEHGEGAAQDGPEVITTGGEAGTAGTAAPERPDNTAAGAGAGAVGAAVTGEHGDAGPGQSAVVGASSDAAGGENRAAVNDGPANLWRVQVGAFVKKENAEALASKLRSEGYDVYIVKPSG